MAGFELIAHKPVLLLVKFNEILSPAFDKAVVKGVTHLFDAI